MKKFFTVIAFVFLFSVLNILFITMKDSVYLMEKNDGTPVIHQVKPFPVTKETLPADLVWENGENEKSFASPKAKKGGTRNTFITTFPPNFRQIGPESNSSFRIRLDENDLSLIDIHPETDKIIPALAKAWAIGKDKRTVYYKLDPDARWSDGQPVTADDFVCCIKIMRAPGIISPWHNEYYSSQIESVLKFDDHTIAVRLPSPKADIIYSTTIRPMPYHYYGNFRTIKKKYSISKALAYLKRDGKEASAELLKIKADFDKTVADYEKLSDKEGVEKPSQPKVEIEVEDVEESWVKNNDWKIQPRTGPYNIYSYIKGKEVVFARNEDWWAKDKKLYKNRYNVDFQRYTIIRDIHIAYEHFLKGKLDNYGLVLPLYWHSKAKYLDQVDKGYMTKVWYYTDRPQPSYQISFNVENELLKDKNIRLGIIHSMNIQEIIDTVLRGDYSIAETFHEGYGAYSNRKIKARRFDPKLAAEYFEKAGFGTIDSDGIRINSEGKRLKFKVLYAHASHTERLLVLQNEARKLGLELKLEQYDPTAVFKAFLSKKHEIAWHGWAPQYRPNYRGQYHGVNAGKPQNNNFSNINDDELSALIDQYRDALDSKIKIATAHKIEERIYDLAPAMPTYKVPYFREALWRWVMLPDDIATRVSESSVDSLGLFWIDEEVKKETLKAMKEDKIFYDTPKLIKVTRDNGTTKKTVQ